MYYVTLITQQNYKYFSCYVIIVFAEEPQTQPLMFAGKLKYIKDEPVKINCTSYSAFPATNLTWFINDKKVSEKDSNINNI